MKHYFALFSAVLLLAVTIALAGVSAQANDTELEYRSAAAAAKTGDEVVVDVVLKNPERQKVISVRSWLKYDPAQLTALGVMSSDSLFTLSAPGEDGVDAPNGLVKIGRSNIGGGVTEPETVVATVKFKVKTASAVTAKISAHDYQVTELGHTNVNIIDQGFPVNVLSKEPKALSILLNGGAPAGASGGSSVVTVPADIPLTVNTLPDLTGAAPLLDRPMNLRVGTAAGVAELRWDAPADPDRSGFNVYYGKTSGQYSRRRTVGNFGSARIDSLNNGETYFFAVTAYNALNQESDYSDEAGIIINEPLSSTAPFAGAFSAALSRIPKQPANGPLTWWILVSAIGLSGSLLFRKKHS